MAMGPLRPRAGRYRHAPMSEINVTPFVDVMLVLLIVFMVTAPLLTVGVPVDLPKTAAQSIPGQDEPLTVTVNKAGRIYLQETEVAIEELVPRLTAIAKRKTDTRVSIRGDNAINYGRVLEVMGTLTASGYTRVALIADSRAAVERERPANRDARTRGN